MTTLQQKRKELGKLHAEINEIEAAKKRLEAAERRKTMIGKVYAYRNCYSCPEKASDYWFMYVRIDAVNDEGWYTTTEFQTDKHGNVRVESNEFKLWHTIEDDGRYNEITPLEWRTARAKLLTLIDKMVSDSPAAAHGKCEGRG